MHGFTTKVLLAVVAQAHASDLQQDAMDLLANKFAERAQDKLFDKVVDKLVGKFDLDSSTLRKPAQLAASPHTQLRPVVPLRLASSRVHPVPRFHSGRVAALKQPSPSELMSPYREKKWAKYYWKADLGKFETTENTIQDFCPTTQRACTKKEFVDVFATADDLSAALVDKMIVAAEESIKEKDAFVLAVAADSPVVDNALAGLVARKSECDFDKWTLLFVSEKCPGGDNAKKADTWTQAVGLAADRIITVGGGNAQEEAPIYASKIEDLLAKKLITNKTKGVARGPSLDLVLLGTGEEGQIGALTPETMPKMKPKADMTDDDQLGFTSADGGPGPNEVRAQLTGDDAEFQKVGLLQSRTAPVGPLVLDIKKNAITLTFRVINAARRVVVAASGEKMATVIPKALSGHLYPNIPIGQVDPGQGTLLWMLDAAAATEVRKNKKMQ